MPPSWPALPYDEWSDTCDTVHAYTQLLGKIALALAPPEPELQHSALRLTSRGWETAPLAAPNGSGAVTVVLDLRMHEIGIEHADGGGGRVSLVPDRPVGEVVNEVLPILGHLAGEVRINPVPQEVPWSVPLDEDDEHRTYDPVQAATYFAAASRAALVLAALRAPYRGRSSPVNAWWGSFDVAVSLFSGREAEPPSRDFIYRNSADAQQVEVGWWPGDHRHRSAAFFGYTYPAPDSFAAATLSPAAARWDGNLGEYLLEWEDVISQPDPFATALEFCRAVTTHACTVCDWEPRLAHSLLGDPPAVR